MWHASAFILVASISFKPMSNECGAIATEPNQIELVWKWGNIIFGLFQFVNFDRLWSNRCASFSTDVCLGLKLRPNKCEFLGNEFLFCSQRNEMKKLFFWIVRLGFQLLIRSDPIGSTISETIRKSILWFKGTVSNGFPCHHSYIVPLSNLNSANAQTKWRNARM